MIFYSISGGELAKRICREYGCEFLSQKGSHIKLRHTSGHQIVVPAHREIRIGTLYNICAKISSLYQIDRDTVMATLFVRK